MMRTTVPVGTNNAGTGVNILVGTNIIADNGPNNSGKGANNTGEYE